MVNLRLGNGVLASYQQCHFTPDYWRNYTVIGTEGRIENFGDVSGSEVRLWNRRHNGAAPADETFIVPEAPRTPGTTAPTRCSSPSSCGSCATAGSPRRRPSPPARRSPPASARPSRCAATGRALAVPPLDPDLVDYFERGQVADRAARHRDPESAVVVAVVAE